ncbi:MAG: iron-containing alcohol dehydrogenase [Candidatus Hodarchaeota archaeon]
MSKRDIAWYEDPDLKNLYIKAASNAMRGYHAPIVHPKITFTGTNSLNDLTILLGAYLTDDEKRVLIVVDRDIRKLGEKVAKKLKELRNIGSRIFDNVIPEVPLNTVREAVAICEEYDPKVIIAVGGGSTMDMAKVIMIYYEKPEINVNTMMAPSYLGLRKKIFLLCAIPTTSGTGAEASFNAMVTNTDRVPPKKVEVPLYEICPDYVVLHSDFTKSMPPYLTMGTGMDALAHCMGAYVLQGSTVYTDIHNLKATEMILHWLPRAIKRGNDLEAREQMLMAAFIAGVGFINTNAAGIEHSLGHSFGGIFHVHHGVSVGIFLAASIAFQSKVTDRFYDLAKIFGIEKDGKTRDQILKELLEALQYFMKKIGAPISIKALEKTQISKDDMKAKKQELINYAFNDTCTLFSTRKLDPPQIWKIFEVAYENKIEDLMELYYM